VTIFTKGEGRIAYLSYWRSKRCVQATQEDDQEILLHMNDDAFSDDEADEHNEGAVDIGIPHDETVELAGTQIDQHYGHRFTVTVSPDSEDGDGDEEGDVNSQLKAVMARSSDGSNSNVNMASNQPVWDPSQYNHSFASRKGVRHIRNRAHKADRDKEMLTRLAVDRFLNDWQEDACAMDTNSTLVVGRPQDDEDHDSIVANEMDIVHIAQYDENIYGMRGAETIGCNIEAIDGDNFDRQACRLSEGMIQVVDSVMEAAVNEDTATNLIEKAQPNRKRIKNQRKHQNRKLKKISTEAGNLV
jgi:predicted site-specific integrase-resolvase